MTLQPVPQDRDAIRQWILEHVSNLGDASPTFGVFRGGRRAAERTLSAVAPKAYGQTRNFLGGQVTRLSPYISHGVLSLREVYDAVIAREPDPRKNESLIKELAWRDFWQRVAQVLKDTWRSVEAPKTGRAENQWHHTLPSDLEEAKTDLACMDGFSQEMQQSGYLHNHARLWLASYLVHFRRVHWRAGAQWFLNHLIDGDEASNNLSWQWVASTFSQKPYIFNRENLEQYTEGRYCKTCPSRHRCPFDDSYESLQHKLFGANPPASPSPEKIHSLPVDKDTDDPPKRPLVWVQSSALRENHPAYQAYPDAPRVFICDDGAWPKVTPSFKVWGFRLESLAEMQNVQLIAGSTTRALKTCLRELDCDGIVAPAELRPWRLSELDHLAQRFPVRLIPEKPLATVEEGTDITRFSRYWKAVEPELLPQDAS